jgi:hypothetical protein
MPEKMSVRLSAVLYDDLQHAARRRHTTPSAIVRLALQQVLDQSTPASTPSALPPNDALEWLVMTLPPEVQKAIRQAVTTLGLPLGGVLKALIITACQPKTVPQLPHESSGMCRDSPVSPGAGPRSIPRSRG